ncbi:MAG: prepilin-type N-terminal cleavage/methylation domain-containing protein, partial [Phycisphaerae bacterium]|nr:prepilin-type N-terminal cleavage/methylation domain-containing protein [Phycisphaerae bacterium]
MIDRYNLFTMRPSGFTLIEVLTASVILAIAVTTICSLSARSLSQTRRSLDLEQAWQMMDRQFTLIEQMGIKDFIERGVSEGEIEASIDEKTGQ